MSGHADTIRPALYEWWKGFPEERDDGEGVDALAALDALLAENQRLREALEEACDWLDADLAHAPSTPTSMADRERVARWREVLAGEDG